MDDEAFARQFAEHRFGSRKEGSRAVVNGLRAAGIAPSLAVAVAEEAPEDEEERAMALANARAPRLRASAPRRRSRASRR